MPKFLIPLFIFLISFSIVGNATHNRAGDITIRQIGPLEVIATVVIYSRNCPQCADRDSIDIDWGDGVITTLARSNGPFVNGNRNGESLGNELKKNIYTGRHVYGGRRTYRIGVSDPNRVANILNVDPPNSVYIPFYLETIYTFLNPQFQGNNSTPILLQDPIDYACVGQPFRHNPSAFDPDRDSIAYRLAVPRQERGSPVPNYSLPNFILPGLNNQLTLDERTGDLLWDSPQRAGEYNITIAIISYRSGFAIDTVVRDMQILVTNCNNKPPLITGPDRICVIAGETIEFDVIGTDPDIGQKIKLSATGGPLAISNNAATFNVVGGIDFQNPPVIGKFRWTTDCNNISDQYYTLVIKAEDNFGNGAFQVGNLVYLKTIQIKVVGPPPTNLISKSESNKITLNWDNPYSCENAANNFFRAFTVWRRESSNNFQLDTCSPGLSGKGYQKISNFTKTIDDGKYQFVDSSIIFGKIYCYRVLAEFAQISSGGNPFNLVESLASNETCNIIGLDVPLVLQADVKTTSVNLGRVFIEWTKPFTTKLDTIKSPPPYVYELYSSIDNQPFSNTPIFAQTANSFSAKIDTSFFQNNLNTISNSYKYKIRFYSGNQKKLVGESGSASTVFLRIASSDKINQLSWESQTPWTNQSYIINKKNNLGVFVPLDTVTQTNFDDIDVANGNNYCYFIKSIGTYQIGGVKSPLFNSSQEACGIPVDTSAPCPPILDAENICSKPSNPLYDERTNFLFWKSPKEICPIKSRDLKSIKVYFSPTENGVFSQINDIPLGTNDFKHIQDISLAGCYYLTSIDSIGNESSRSNIICLDNCPTYTLPNTFTPNGDSENDLFFPIISKFIAKVDFKVFNQWGAKVFETNDPLLKWDGKDLSGSELPDGNYAFICQVFENRVSGVIPQNKPLSGTITLIRK
jgi:gliding motility-associated-like protein